MCYYFATYSFKYVWTFFGENVFALRRNRAHLKCQKIECLDCHWVWHFVTSACSSFCFFLVPSHSIYYITLRLFKHSRWWDFDSCSYNICCQQKCVFRATSIANENSMGFACSHILLLVLFVDVVRHFWSENWKRIKEWQQKWMFDCGGVRWWWTKVESSKYFFSIWLRIHRINYIFVHSVASAKASFNIFHSFGRSFGFPFSFRFHFGYREIE